MSRWYVKSRGRLVDHDYVWLALEGTDASPAQQISDRGYRGRDCKSLVDSERPGLLLFDDERGHLVLLVTYLIPKGQPTDFRRRTIRVTLLGQADLSDDAACREMIAVTATALRGELGEKLPISFDSRRDGAGFAVDPAAWSKYGESAARGLRESRDPAIEPAIHGPDNEAFRREVADDVVTICLRGELAKLVGRILVLRTDILDKSDLEQIRPWRTVSRLVDTPTDLARPTPTTHPLVTFGVELTKELAREAGKAVAEAVKNKYIAGGSGAAVIAVVAVLFFVLQGHGQGHPHHHRPPPPHPVAAKSAVLAWGQNQGGDLGVPVSAVPAGTTPVSLAAATTKLIGAAAGSDFSLALTSTRQVLAWGSGSRGQLGNGGTLDSTAPVPVTLRPAGTTVLAVSAGCQHSLALTSGHVVLAWGSNSDDRLGTGTVKAFNSTPVRVRLPGNPRIRSISAGCADGLALTETGRVLAWGSRAYGEMGLPPRRTGHGPHLVYFSPKIKITAINAGCSFNLALAADGAVYAWGDDRYGQLGRAAHGGYSYRPVPVPGTGPGGARVTQIAAGCDHALALTTGGAVLAWGSDRYGQLGDRMRARHVYAPVPVALPGRLKVADIAAGSQFSLALTSDGQVLAWGDNRDGRLADGTPDSFSAKPVLVRVAQGSLKISVLGAGPAANHVIAIGLLAP